MRQRRRRITAVLIGLIIALFGLWQSGYLEFTTATPVTEPVVSQSSDTNTSTEAPLPGSAADALETLAVKGRAPKTNYARTQFGNGWALVGGCDMRNTILQRDLLDVEINETCKVMTGTLNDPYSGKTIVFVRGATTSDDVQIDHVVALSNAWQTGAQALTPERRAELANDPLELISVDGPTNQAKGDGDAATWLPPHKPFRCQYVARQIAVKQKYELWVTQAEKDAMRRVLASCPNQSMPIK